MDFYFESIRFLVDDIMNLVYLILDDRMCTLLSGRHL